MCHPWTDCPWCLTWTNKTCPGSHFHVFHTKSVKWMESTWGCVAVSSWEHVSGMEEAESWDPAPEERRLQRMPWDLSVSLTWHSSVFGSSSTLYWSHKVLWTRPILVPPPLESPSHPPTHSWLPDFSDPSSPLLSLALGVASRKWKDKTCPFQILAKKILNVSHQMRSGTGNC